MTSHRHWMHQLKLPKIICAISVWVSLIALVAAMTDSATARVLSPRPLYLSGSCAAARFSIHGTNGYKIKVLGTRDFARITAWRRHSAAVYVSEQASLGHRAFSARFGGLGKVSVRFYPQAASAKDPKKSFASGLRGDGGGPGIFKGTVEFEGEQHFTSVAVHRVRGRWDSAKGSCQHVSYGPSPEKEADETDQLSLGVAIVQKKVIVEFEAGRGALRTARSFGREASIGLDLANLKGSVPFVTISTELRPALHILRFVVAGGGRQMLTLSPSGGVLTVSPGGPFSGSALFEACLGSRWSGNLMVDLPGRSAMPLTGKLAFAVLRPPVRCG